MNRTTHLAPHESLELHEIIRSEMTAAVKLKASMMMVQDDDLKSFMQTALQTKQNAIRQFQSLYDEKVMRQ